MKVKFASNVPQTFQSAVSPTFKSAGLANVRRDAGLKTCDTAGRNACGTSGFTMVEIAICLAVIGFALVAIIGVLPMGIQVQTDNRQDTIINHEAAYFLDAIRKGAPPDDLRLYVEEISLTYTNDDGIQVVHTTNAFRATDPNHHIIGLLSSARAVKTEAIIRSLSGAAGEKGDYTNDIAFKYKMTAIVRPLETLNPDWATNALLFEWQTNLAHEVRLLFRYPLTFDGKTGAGKKVVRAIVGGKVNRHPDEALEFFFYRHGLTNTPANNGIFTNIFAL